MFPAAYATFLFGIQTLCHNVNNQNVKIASRERPHILPSHRCEAFENLLHIDSGAPRAKGACGAPWVNKSTHPRKFGNHVTERPTDRPSAPQAYQCLFSHFLARLGAQEKADCTSMLSSIDSCQNRVSADQYHLTVSRAQVSTHQGRVFF